MFRNCYFILVLAERDAMAQATSPFIVHLFYSLQSKQNIYLVSIPLNIIFIELSFPCMYMLNKIIFMSTVSGHASRWHKKETLNPCIFVFYIFTWYCDHCIVTFEIWFIKHIINIKKQHKKHVFAVWYTYKHDKY